MGAAVDGDRPVVVVTGGGAGIGAAVAEELGRTGWFVVTVDPMVSLDGATPLPEPEQTTAGRIVAAGGTARASSASVTDAEAIRRLVAEVVEERGRLDAVVNVAGISRPTSFATGSGDDWGAVLSVHLDGYLNVLGAALPVMARAGRGRVVGVTSGSGWRAADAGAYGCAKRAVAALTWQLGVAPPDGVSVNAMSPIAVTRMVTAALGRAGRPGGSGAATTGGLSLGWMPAPEQLGPTGAHLVAEGFAWCSGRVVFVGGSEVSVVDPPRLLEAVRTSGAASVAHVLDAVTDRALVPAEATQGSAGATNPRFGPVFDERSGPAGPPVVARCAVVSDRPEVAAEVRAALAARDVDVVEVDATELPATFEAASQALGSAGDPGDVDGVVVALGGPAPAGEGAPWERVLSEHHGLVEHLFRDAAWSRAAADHAASAGRPQRLVVLTDATTAGGRSRAQAAAQLSRAATGATEGSVASFAVALEATADDGAAAGEVTAHLLCSPAAAGLAGAELVVGAGWFGVRSHPRPGGSITFGGPEVPPWLDAALRDAAGVTTPADPARPHGGES